MPGFKTEQIGSFLERLTRPIEDLCARVLCFTGLDKQIFRGALKRLAASSHDKPLRIIITCKGNICRSPYAETRLRELTRGDELMLEVASRGLETTPGKQAHDLTIRFAQEQGLDLSSHRTQSLSEHDVEQADLVLVVESNHLRKMRKSFPNYTQKLLLLPSLTLNDFPTLTIRDPYTETANAHTRATFLHTFTVIDRALIELVKEIKRVQKKNGLRQ